MLAPVRFSFSYHQGFPDDVYLSSLFFFVLPLFQLPFLIISAVKEEQQCRLYRFLSNSKEDHVGVMVCMGDLWSFLGFYLFLFVVHAYRFMIQG